MRALALAVLLVAAPAAADPASAVDLVDPFIGTGGHGHTFPGPTLPFGMIQPGPDTRVDGWDGCSGYHADDTSLYGFSHTHLSGTGVSDYGDILFLPTTTGRTRTPFRKQSESASPGDYRVTLDDGPDNPILVELTATARTGWHRYGFPAGVPGEVRVDLRHRDKVIDSSLHLVGDRRLEGMRRSTGWARDQVVYFVAEFSRPFTVHSTASALDARLRFAPGPPLVIKVALSPVDLDGARRNLAAEAPGWDFECVRAQARAVWNRALGAVELEGGTAAQRTTFYTALYHALVVPNLFQDVDGRTRGLDGKIHRADGYTRHTVFSLWDTFRAAHPLYTILQRQRTRDFVRTFLEMYRESGRLPVWELAGNETDCMIGYHAASVILDAWVKGIRDFAPALALQAMKATAAGDRFGLASYRRHGFVRAEDEAESVSRTLEYAYDDWCIARFAQLTGHLDDARIYYARAQAWQHLLDTAGFMHARADGRWKTPFDPAAVTFDYTEANAWQYSFFVPHDVDTWMARLGGPGALERKLDQLFAADSRTTGRQQVDITGLVGQYAHGNEPSHHMAYLYAFAGVPAKTQALVHRLVAEMYAARPDGLIGNEDCGQMSAWLVLSALGFYPVTPGTPDYVLGTPLFDRATLTLENGHHFTIRARRSGPGDFYVQSVTLDGRPHPRAVLTEDEILAGGELVFTLGPRPSAWGSAIADRPHTAVPPTVTPAPVAAGPELATGPTKLILTPAASGDVIRYTVDGRVPDDRSLRYTGPLTVAPPATITFRSFRAGVASPVVEASVRKLDPDRKVTLRTAPSPQYAAGGGQALVDGVQGALDFRLGHWLGFSGVELEAELDLGRPTALHHLRTGFLHDPGSWIFLPQEVHYELSTDGRSWHEAGVAHGDVDARDARRVRRALGIPVDERARFVRVRTRSLLRCPPWHPGAGGAAHVFADEIMVD